MKITEKVFVKKGCHSRKSLSGIYDACSCVREQQTTWGEDPRNLRAANSSGMTTNCKYSPSFALTGHLPLHWEAAKIARGFTLLELLVVVLIIGILAAVALPQYQKAVDKSFYSQQMILAKNVQEQQELFYLQNGEYAGNCEELNPELPAGGTLNADTKHIDIEKQNIEIRCGDGGKTRVSVMGPVAGFTLFFSHMPEDFPKPEWAGRKGCLLNNTNELSYATGARPDRLCKTLGETRENYVTSGVNLGIIYFF